MTKLSCGSEIIIDYCERAFNRLRVVKVKALLGWWGSEEPASQQARAFFPFRSKLTVATLSLMSNKSRHCFGLVLEQD